MVSLIGTTAVARWRAGRQSTDKQEEGFHDDMRRRLESRGSLREALVALTCLSRQQLAQTCQHPPIRSAASDEIIGAAAWEST